MSITSVDIFRARAEGRALFITVGLYRNVAQAMDPLLEEASKDGLYPKVKLDELQRIIDEALDKYGVRRG